MDITKLNDKYSHKKPPVKYITDDLLSINEVTNNSEN